MVIFETKSSYVEKLDTVEKNSFILQLNISDFDDIVKKCMLTVTPL